jgi:hypothetical protein
MKPLCFVLMPFGRKGDASGRLTDFDAIYQQIIAPSILAADMEPMRADQEQMGGAIHKAMFECLLLSEYALADVTGANPNVFYELGIRHATRPRSTVILFAEGTTLPFDVALLRGVSYRTDNTGIAIEPERQIDVIARLLKTVRMDSRDDSPLFQLLDGMPRLEFDQSRMGALRGRLDQVKKLKARLGAACRAGKVAVQALGQDPALGNLLDIDPGVFVDLLVSFGEVKAYQEMVDFHARMPPFLQRARRVQELLSLALPKEARRGRTYPSAAAGGERPEQRNPWTSRQSLYRSLGRRAECRGKEARSAWFVAARDHRIYCRLPCGLA